MTVVDDPEAWMRLFRATLPELYAHVARRSGGDRGLAEDVTQETWLRAVTAWRSKGAPEQPLAWLKTTASNLLSNHLRALRRRGTSESSVAPEALPDVSRTTDDARELVREGLASLSARDGELVRAFHLDGRSTRELARDHGASERAIEGRLHRARLLLRRFLHRGSP